MEITHRNRRLNQPTLTFMVHGEPTLEFWPFWDGFLTRMAPKYPFFMTIPRLMARYNDVAQAWTISDIFDEFLPRIKFKSCEDFSILWPAIIAVVQPGKCYLYSSTKSVFVSDGWLQCYLFPLIPRSRFEGPSLSFETLSPDSFSYLAPDLLVGPVFFFYALCSFNGFISN